MEPTRTASEAQPEFVALLAHPLRWRLLQELVRSDRMVRELTESLDVPQNLVSYHLRQLREAGLVSAKRSSADGRDSYYAVDLAHCRNGLQTTGAALHPALQFAPAPIAPDVHALRHRSRVLFLCTGNSARSQIAEALLEQMSGRRVEAASAGSQPKALHPNAVRVMRKRGVDISANRTKHLDEFLNQRFDMVITLCDRVREVCPEFPSHPERVHWSVADPALAGTTARASLPAFERTAVDLTTRIGFLLHVIALDAPKNPSTPKRRTRHAH